MLKPKFKLNRELCGVVGLTIFFYAINCYWRFLDQNPAHWDMARHLATAFQYYDYLKHGDLKHAYLSYHYYPPFYYLVASPYFLIFNRSVITAVASNLTFMLALSLSTYFSAKKLFSARLGLVAAFLVLTFPMLSSQFKEFQLDAPLTALVSLALMFLLYSDGFTNRKHVLAFGLTCGLGLLTKWTFCVFVFLPALYLLGEKLYHDRQAWSKIVANVLWCLLVILVVAGPWYYSNLVRIKQDIKAGGIQSAIREGDPVGFTWPAFTFYAWTLIESHLWLIGTILLVCSILVCLWHGPTRAKTMPYLLSILSGYLVFSIFANKDARYIMPIMAGSAILITALLAALPQKPRSALVAALFAYGIFVYFETSFGLPLTKDFGWPTADHRHSSNLFLAHSYTIFPPQRQSWHLDDAFKLVQGDTTGPRTIQFLGSDRPEFNRWDLAYYSQLYGAEWMGENTTEVNYRYLIYRSVNEQEINRLVGQFMDNGYSVAIWGDWELPDSSHSYLVQLTSKPKVELL